MKSVLDIFRELTSVPTAPFYERAVMEKALGWLRRELRGRVRVLRRRGGIIASYRGAGAGPSLALAAHLDHPAFHLRRVSRSGAAAVTQGGLPPHLLEGSFVEAFPARPRDNRRIALGVLSGGTDKTLAVRWTEPPGHGEKPAFACLALPPFEREGPWVLSRSIDDLMGAAMSLEVLRRAVRAKLKTNLVVLLHRAEEVGFVGALDLIAEGAVSPLDSVISVETSRELPGARPGRGPVIRLGDKASVFDGNLTALLDEAARGRRVQRQRLTGGTCEATAYLAFGYEAGGVAIPLVNYHNGWGARAVAPEKVRVEDIRGAVELMLQAARLFLNKALRGRQQERLRKHHRRLCYNLRTA